jgi:hypothetical protein
LADLSTDVLVVGGGLGGVAAALAAARNGRDVVLTEETEWLGGQLTSQGVPPDEHPWIEQFGCTRSYRQLRDEIRAYYRRWYPLTSRARASQWLNPGAAMVSKLCFEPRVGVAVLEAMLAPYRAHGRLRVLLRTRPVAANADGDRLTSVTLEGPDDERTTIAAPYVVDATETGDLLPLADIEYVTGFESQADTGEPSAPEQAQPLNMQAITVCMAFEHFAGEDHTIDKPEDYPFWRDYVPRLTPAWPGRQLSLTASHPHTLEPLHHTFTPNPEGDPSLIVADQSKNPGSSDLWLYRRLLARRQFTEGTLASDIVLGNWPMLDYLEGPVFDVDEDTAAGHLDGARRLTRSMFYWLQTEAPRPDGGTGYPGLRLRGDVLGTDDGLAMAPYIRESRRIRARTTIVEQDLSLATRGAAGAVDYPDSVGVGMYRIDLHPSTGGDNYIDVGSCPYQIPLGALLPVRSRNLLAGNKNIGTTHITNGAYRLHPTEWNIGEVAGLLAAHCVENRVEPHQVHSDADQLAAFQARCESEGIERSWPAVRGY